MTHAFRDGLTASLVPSVETRRYAEPNPLFVKHREDGKFRLAVQLRHRALRYRGFMPYIGYSFERNRSNIPLEDYTNNGASIGMTGRL